MHRLVCLAESGSENIFHCSGGLALKFHLQPHVFQVNFSHKMNFLQNHRSLQNPRAQLANWNLEMGEREAGRSSLPTPPPAIPRSPVGTEVRRKSTLKAVGDWCYQKMGWPGQVKEKERSSSIF